MFDETEKQKEYVELLTLKIKELNSGDHSLIPLNT